MPVLSLNQAHALLDWAATQYPGQWVDHVKTAGRAAGIIAQAAGLNAEQAEALGLVHDIGRYNGATSLKHVYDGYVLMRERGFDQAAQICLTHSFVNHSLTEYLGTDDCTPSQRRELETALAAAVYTEYDRLIQLCDSLCLPEGVCLMEKRMIDISLRYGVNDQVVEKWNSLFSIFNSFSAAAGKNLYTLFPEAAAVTFAI